jgi:hypothetical protein
MLTVAEIAQELEQESHATRRVLERGEGDSSLMHVRSE